MIVKNGDENICPNFGTEEIRLCLILKLWLWLILAATPPTIKTWQWWWRLCSSVATPAPPDSIALASPSFYQDSRQLVIHSNVMTWPSPSISTQLYQIRTPAPADSIALGYQQAPSPSLLHFTKIALTLSRTQEWWHSLNYIISDSQRISERVSLSVVCFNRDISKTVSVINVCEKRIIWFLK